MNVQSLEHTVHLIKLACRPPASANVAQPDANGVISIIDDPPAAAAVGAAAGAGAAPEPPREKVRIRLLMSRRPAACMEMQYFRAEMVAQRKVDQATAMATPPPLPAGTLVLPNPVKARFDQADKARPVYKR